MRQTILTFIIFVVATNICFSQQQQQQLDDPIINAIKEETERACSKLKEDGQPSILFLSTNLIQTKLEVYRAYKGEIIECVTNPETVYSQIVTIMNIGDTLVAAPLQSIKESLIDIENNPTAIKMHLWRTYDRLYKQSVKGYIQRTNLDPSTKGSITPEQLKLCDFSHADTAMHIEPLIDATYDRATAKQYIQEASKVFSENDSLLHSEVGFARVLRNCWMYNSEGSIVRTSVVLYNIYATMQMYGNVEEPIRRVHSISISSLEELPPVEDFKNECRKIMAEGSVTKPLVKQDRIELATVIMDDRSVSVCLNKGKILGGSIVSLGFNVSFSENYKSGEKLKPTLNNLKGSRVISNDITIKSLNGMKSYKDVAFLNYSPVDVLGTRAPDTMIVVEKGVLRNLTNTRVPTVDFPISNGHCNFRGTRMSPSITILKVEIDKNKLYSSREKLYDAMIRRAKERGEQYIYIVDKHQVTKRLDINTNDLVQMEVSIYGINIDLRYNSAIFGATSEEYVDSSGYITPKSIVYEGVEIMPQRNTSNYDYPKRRPIVERPR